jgi:hypothetical protein
MHQLVKHFINVFILTFSSFLCAHTYQGELAVLIFDDFEHKKSKTIYQLDEAGEVYVLYLTKSMKKNNLLSGDQVIIEGQEVEGLKDKTIKVRSLIVQHKNSITNPPARDNRKILPLLLNFNNMQTTHTVSVSDVDSILHKSLQSAQRNFLRSSFKQLNFTRVKDKNDNPAIYVVNLNYDANHCNYNQWANDALNAATEMGVDISLFRHYMFILPRNVSCNWGGLAYLGCGDHCKTWVVGYNPELAYSKLIYSHQLGHNIGMDHSAVDLNNDGTTDAKYGDAACIMGVGDYQYYKEINAPHRDQMGWFNAYPERIATVTSGSRFKLFPLEAGLNHTELLAIKIPRNATETYYFSLRKNRGLLGSGAPYYLDKISVHKTIAGDYHTYFIKSLAEGETFSDPAYNISFTPVAIGTYYAMVQIS